MWEYVTKYGNEVEVATYIDVYFKGRIKKSYRTKN